ncbi:hypothetical protein HDU97_001506 [Phlyctochytrium planicorne]|nr:hypothetical protein HDU97_001506 [Phlyctochytrium planicorne]
MQHQQTRGARMPLESADGHINRGQHAPSIHQRKSTAPKWTSATSSSEEKSGAENVEPSKLTSTTTTVVDGKTGKKTLPTSQSRLPNPSSNSTKHSAHSKTTTSRPTTVSTAATTTIISGIRHTKATLVRMQSIASASNSNAASHGTTTAPTRSVRRATSVSSIPKLGTAKNPASHAPSSSVADAHSGMQRREHLMRPAKSMEDLNKQPLHRRPEKVRPATSIPSEPDSRMQPSRIASVTSTSQAPVSAPSNPIETETFDNANLDEILASTTAEELDLQEQTSHTGMRSLGLQGPARVSLAPANAARKSIIGMSVVSKIWQENGSGSSYYQDVDRYQKRASIYAGPVRVVKKSTSNLSESSLNTSQPSSTDRLLALLNPTAAAATSMLGLGYGDPEMDAPMRLEDVDGGMGRRDFDGKQYYQQQQPQHVDPPLAKLKKGMEDYFSKKTGTNANANVNATSQMLLQKNAVATGGAGASVVAPPKTPGPLRSMVAPAAAARGMSAVTPRRVPVAFFPPAVATATSEVTAVASPMRVKVSNFAGSAEDPTTPRRIGAGPGTTQTVGRVVARPTAQQQPAAHHQNLARTVGKAVRDATMDPTNLRMAGFVGKDVATAARKGMLFGEEEVAAAMAASGGGGGAGAVLDAKPLISFDDDEDDYRRRVEMEKKNEAALSEIAELLGGLTVCRRNDAGKLPDPMEVLGMKDFGKPVTTRDTAAALAKTAEENQIESVAVAAAAVVPLAASVVEAELGPQEDPASAAVIPPVTKEPCAEEEEDDAATAVDDDEELPAEEIQSRLDELAGLEEELEREIRELEETGEEEEFEMY